MIRKHAQKTNRQKFEINKFEICDSCLTRETVSFRLVKSSLFISPFFEKALFPGISI